ncbi:hypothetical protein FB382_001333 [Nocardioides ginsengisegetis]|uniref:Uncharacterized protein n=1 Tax=Nocardioides ginsengisegetis TaxID=661491 RepID=A0A7W3IYN4_9ACTN|nr:hypothetical protein [Nocardioides ginsengisegetis]MBA8803042.1 hypothetical protein [Nocardioides ginsengisegetis]
MTARVAALIAVVMVALSLTLAPATAAKSWPKLVLSRDGHAWSADLGRPLFGAKRRWVPGDGETRTFYARNQSGEDARLRVTFTVSDPTTWLEAGRLRMSVLANGTWTPVRAAGRTGVVHMLARRGEVVPVKVRVRLLPDAGARSMDRSLRFDIAVRLTELSSWKEARA